MHGLPIGFVQRCNLQKRKNKDNAENNAFETRKSKHGPVYLAVRSLSVF